SKLFFPNVEMLGDQHEGKIPQEIFEMMLVDEKINESTNSYAENTINWLVNKRKKILISSWTAKETESFAMWKMYAKDKLGVAIKTDFEGLKNSFKYAQENIYIGEVFLYNKTSPQYLIGNTFFPFLVKHNYYEFESEVRCIAKIKD